MKTSFKTGDRIETVYGETLVVLKVDENYPVKKNKKLIGTACFILAESGGHPTWFPMSKIKGLVD